MRESFVFYKSYHEAISVVPPEIQLELYKNICHYALYGEISEMSSMAKAMFTLMKANLDASDRKYRAAIENGKKGGRPRKTEQEPHQNRNETEQEPKHNPTETEIKPKHNPTITETKPSYNPIETEIKPNHNLNVNDNVTMNDNVTENDNPNETEAVTFTSTDAFDLTPSAFFEAELREEEAEEEIEHQKENDRGNAVSFLPLADGTEYPIYAKKADEWYASYPGIDIEAELRRMRLWLDANPQKKKSEREIERFIVGWLNNALEKQKSRAADSSAKRSAVVGASTPGFDLDEFWKSAIARSNEIMEELDRENNARKPWK